jgi:hypothetical protein
MMRSLPFLKRRKLPRHQEPGAEKEVGLSGDEELESQAISELMDAAEARDPKLFRQAMEALVMCAFEYGEDHE